MNYLSVEEAAVRLGKSGITVRRWAKSGRLRSIVVLGRRVFTVADVEAMLAPQPDDNGRHVLADVTPQGGADGDVASTD